MRRLRDQRAEFELAAEPQKIIGPRIGLLVMGHS